MCVASDSAIGRPQAGDVLRIERAQRPFHGGADPDYSPFYARLKKGDPKLPSH
jgi:hypothetical protein